MMQHYRMPAASARLYLKRCAGTFPAHCDSADSLRFNASAYTAPIRARESSQQEIFYRFQRSVSAQNLHIHARDGIDFKHLLQEGEAQQLKMLRFYYDYQYEQNVRLTVHYKVVLDFFVYPTLKQPTVRYKSIFAPVLSDFYLQYLAKTKRDFVLAVRDRFAILKKAQAVYVVLEEQLNKIRLVFSNNGDALTYMARRSVAKERENFELILGDAQFFDYIICIKWQVGQFYNAYVKSTLPASCLYRMILAAIQRQAYLLKRKSYQMLLSLQRYTPTTLSYCDGK